MFVCGLVSNPEDQFSRSTALISLVLINFTVCKHLKKCQFSEEAFLKGKPVK